MEEEWKSRIFLCINIHHRIKYGNNKSYTHNNSSNNKTTVAFTIEMDMQQVGWLAAVLCSLRTLYRLRHYNICFDEWWWATGSGECVLKPTLSSITTFHRIIREYLSYLYLGVSSIKCLHKTTFATFLIMSWMNNSFCCCGLVASVHMYRGELRDKSF